ncbi:putative 3-beta-hydroxysteroid-4-alpha-carboxylate 3-dehydrogenase (decarboxylating) [Helianthus anomalus]
MAMVEMVDDQSKTCIVLGGRSFVGRSLVARLLKLGFWIVRVADSTKSLQLDPDDHDYDVPLDRALSTGRASYFHVDVRNKKSVINGFLLFCTFILSYCNNCCRFC